MLGFPPPYPEELLYSTIARAGVHDGETSPKQLLDQVFNNRKVVATVDLPSHVQSLVDHYPPTLELDSQTLISRHTLWPVYAPLLPRGRNTKLMNWMVGRSQGAAHLGSGIAASRVKAKTRLYVCVDCLNDQKSKYGESFWNRLWQVPLVRICPEHGPLKETNIELDGEHRHTFIAVEEAEVLGELTATPGDKILSKQAAQLMQEASGGVSFAQWTAFYRQFASSHGYMNGSRIDHVKIHDTVVQFWGKSWLEEAGVFPSGTETSWLKALFRKHRKSFSFAEHIVAVTALSDGEISICDVIKKASSLVTTSRPITQEKKQEPPLENQLSPDQVQWKRLLEHYPPKAARQQNPALYARLYRSHYDWLIHIDSLFHAENVVVNNRVDWLQRDRQIARELRRACEGLSKDLNAPHLSRTFLIHQLEQRATVEKNLHRLPRCKQLLSLYTECTSDYQARRISRAYLAMLESRQEIKRWSLLRQAGLSDERMTDTVAEFLKEILSE